MLECRGSHQYSTEGDCNGKERQRSEELEEERHEEESGFGKEERGEEEEHSDFKVIINIIEVASG